MEVLLLSGFELSSTFPNPICVSKILEAMQIYDDIHVDVACNGVVEKTPVLDWKHNISYMLRRIMCWPSYNPDVVRVCREELFDVLNRKKYDCLFVPHKPYETVYVACQAKKKYPEIKLVIYALDPIANEIDANNGIGKHLFFLTQKAERKAFEMADHIIHMECNKKKYSDKRYRQYFHKFTYLDFPLVDAAKKRSSRKEIRKESILLLYSGALDDTYRSPEYLLHVFNTISRQLNVQLQFFAKGNSVLRIEKERKDNPNILLNGYIPKDELERKMQEADFLVNIGNKFSDMLPSKLLTYFKTGKPIIHIKNQKDDAAIGYLEKYGLFLVIDEEDAVETSAEKLLDYIRHNYENTVSEEYLKTAFEHNTPEWNAEQIRKVLIQ